MFPFPCSQWLRVSLAFPPRPLRLCVSLAFAVLFFFSHAQSPFSFRMAYYGPATDSAWAADHHVRKVNRGFDSVDPDWGLWVHTMHHFTGN